MSHANEIKGIRISWTDPEHSQITFANGFHRVTQYRETEGDEVWFEVCTYVDEAAYDAADKFYARNRYLVKSTDANYASYFNHAATSGLNNTLKSRIYDYMIDVMTDFIGATEVYVT